MTARGKPDKNLADSGATAVRLQKLLSAAGVCSRRTAERMILDGRITVDGKTVTELGVKVEPSKNLVCVDGIAVTTVNAPIYMALHKPKGVLTTVYDPFGRPTVMELLADAPGKVYPVGRLDMDSEGLLIFTNDGELANRLIHPRHKIEKTYRVVVSGRPEGHDLDLLRLGIEIDGKKTLPCRIKEIKCKDRSSLLEVTLKEGRKRQIRIMFDKIGLHVIKLIRIKIGPINLGDLPPGKWRMLKDDEISALKTAVGLPASNAKTD
ncbi:MAG: pseudouridine synthase [Dissulfurimicrobium sp.]|uniref:pseudouridine synthase n=1 Tax=Dissulfurimicrobium TaxID=1769732 RepID=UPI003C775D4D